MAAVVVPFSFSGGGFGFLSAAVGYRNFNLDRSSRFF